MDRSQKVSVASTISESSSTPKSSISGEIDENQNTMDRMDSSQNPQRTLSKHFMSSTISAGTNASFPRKKILSHKDDTPLDNIPPPQNSLNLEDGVKSNTEKPSSIRSVLANYCSSESDGDEHHTKSSKPYDPLTNYLSPRPKYLRYNPNRRCRIIDLQESKEEKKDDFRLPPVGYSALQKVVDSQTRRTDTVISPTQEGITKQENKNQLGAGGAVEIKVERGKCCFKLVFKFMFLLTILAFTTSYMCSPKNNNVGLQLGKISLANYSSMNIIVQQQSQMNYMNLSSGYRHVERRCVQSVLQVEIEVEVMANVSKNDTFDPNNELLKKLPGAKDLEIMKLDFVRTALKGDYKDTSDETTERFGQFQLWEIQEIGSGTFHNNDLPQEENEPLDSERIVDQDTYIGQDSSSETEKAADFIDDANELLEIHQKEEENDPLDSERILDQDSYIGQDSSSETEKAADLIDSANELLEIQQKEEETVNIGLINDIGNIMEETTSWSHKPTEENEHNETFHSTLIDSDYVASWSQETIKENEDNGTVIDSDNVASWCHETSKENGHNGIFHCNMMDSDNVECDGKSTETNVTVQEGITEAQLMALLLILAFLLLVYLVAHGTIQGPVKDSEPVTVVPLKESRKEIASNQAPLSVDRKHLQEKVDTALKPSQTPVFVSEKVIFIKAPDVELLGELVFDDVYSSRSSGGYKQAKTTDSNQVKKTSRTTSSCYDIDDVLLPSGSAAAAAYSSSIDESTTAESSPSRGSFTVEKKISKKQGSRDRSNVKNVVATPVRRSSRIQKRAAVSP